MKKIIVSALVLMMALSAFAGIDSGSTEMSLSFVFLKPEDGDYNQVLVGQVGFFSLSWLEVHGRVIWFGPEGSTRGAAGGGVDLHIAPYQEIVPYVGVGILASIGDIDLAESTLMDFHVGIKSFITDGVSINYSLNQWRDTGPAGTTFFVGMAGVSVYF